MEENGLAPSPKEQISIPQYRTLRFILIIFHYFLYIQGIFKSHLKKVTSIQSASFHAKPQSDLSPYYVNLKNGSTYPPRMKLL